MLRAERRQPGPFLQPPQAWCSTSVCARETRRRCGVNGVLPRRTPGSRQSCAARQRPPLRVTHTVDQTPTLLAGGCAHHCARPKAAGLLIPPTTRPRRWAENCSLGRSSSGGENDDNRSLQGPIGAWRAGVPVQTRVGRSPSDSTATRLEGRVFFRVAAAAHVTRPLAVSRRPTLVAWVKSVAWRSAHPTSGLLHELRTRCLVAIAVFRKPKQCFTSIRGRRRRTVRGKPRTLWGLLALRSRRYLGAQIQRGRPLHQHCEARCSQNAKRTLSAAFGLMVAVNVGRVLPAGACVVAA
jgi:hypothetical protein